MKASSKSQIENNVALQGLLGDVAGLTERLGVDGPSVATCDLLDGGPFHLKGVVDLDSLRKFLVEYCHRLMVPVELPTINQASLMVGQGEFRELMALDQGLALVPEMKVFAESSRWIGQCHAKTMRGMKDHRTVWRYCDAIRTKKAFGWHSVVYGVVLAAYSIPIRQGMLNYCEQIIHGFVDSAGTQLNLETKALAVIKEESTNRMVPHIDHVLSLGAPTGLRVL